jgi:hypothetical protein
MPALRKRLKVCVYVMERKAKVTNFAQLAKPTKVNPVELVVAVGRESDCTA